MKAQNEEWAKQFLKSLFDESILLFDSKPFDVVEQKLIQSVDILTASECGHVMAFLRQVCTKVGVDARVRTNRDVTRIMIAASYWSYLIQAFSMEIMSDSTARRSRWTEVEDLSALPKDDIFKIEEFFSSLKG